MYEAPPGGLGAHPALVPVGPDHVGAHELEVVDRRPTSIVLSLPGPERCGSEHAPFVLSLHTPHSHPPPARGIAEWIVSHMLWGIALQEVVRNNSMARRRLWVGGGLLLCSMRGAARLARERVVGEHNASSAARRFCAASAYRAARAGHCRHLSRAQCVTHASWHSRRLSGRPRRCTVGPGRRGTHCSMSRVAGGGRELGTLFAIGPLHAVALLAEPHRGVPEYGRYSASRRATTTASPSTTLCRLRRCYVGIRRAISLVVPPAPLLVLSSCALRRSSRRTSGEPSRATTWSCCSPLARPLPPGRMVTEYNSRNSARFLWGCPLRRGAAAPDADSILGDAPEGHAA